MSQAPKLIGLADPIKGKEIICVGPIKLGRDEKTNSIAIKHASVSRQHAVITPENGQWIVEDNKSTNGVFINDKRIGERTQLRDGDVLRIGDIPLRFELYPEIAATQVFTKGSLPGTIVSAQPPAPPVAAVPTLVAPPAAPATLPVSAPAPRPVAPQPAPRPAAPQPAPRAGVQDGGENLFEPSLVGQVDMGAQIRAAQAAKAGGGAGAAAAAAANAAAAAGGADAPFEGTMYGGQVARQLVKAIREETPQAAEAKKGGGPAPAVVALPRSRTPNMFLLKLKAMSFAIILIAGLLAFLIWAFSTRNRTEEAKKVYVVPKNDYDRFKDCEGNQIADIDLLPTLKKELTELDRINTEIEDAKPKLAGQPELLAKLNDLQDSVRFMVFERKLKLALTDGNADVAEQQVKELVAHGNEVQKSLQTLVTFLVRFQLFRREYPDDVKHAIKAPPKEKVLELAGLVDEYKREFGQKSMKVYDFKRFNNMASESAESDSAMILAWKQFWVQYEDMQKASASDKPARLEDLKKQYPNLKLVQDIK